MSKSSKLTIHALIEAYTADKVSPYRKLRHRTRENYNSLLRRLDRDECEIGMPPVLVRIREIRLSQLRHRTFLELHAHWSRNGERIPMAHALIGMVRTLVGFGVVFLEDRECERLTGVLHGMKFEMGKGRDVHLTAEQAEAVRMQAHKDGYPSVAIAQAVQYEGTLRQKDIIGEVVPQSEPGISDVLWQERARKGKERVTVKWMRGIRWNELGEDMVLRHITSKTQKLVEIDFKLAPMVIEELQIAYCDLGEPLTRAKLPKSGPIILDEETGRPYLAHVFRRRWRMIAKAAGVPDEVQNRDTRAGAITEAIESGASIEDAQKAAKHSTTAMTAKYWRGDAKATARAMTMRAAARARKKQNDQVA